MEFQGLILDSATLNSFFVTQGGATLWGIFGVVFILFLVVSAALVYHLERYGYDRYRIKFTELLFFSVSLVLLLVMAGAILSF